MLKKGRGAQNLDAAAIIAATGKKSKAGYLNARARAVAGMSVAVATQARFATTAASRVTSSATARSCPSWTVTASPMAWPSTKTALCSAADQRSASRMLIAVVSS